MRLIVTAILLATLVEGCRITLFQPVLDFAAIEAELMALADSLEDIAESNRLIADDVADIAQATEGIGLGVSGQSSVEITVDGIVVKDPRSGEFVLVEDVPTSNVCDEPDDLPLPNPITLGDEICTRNPIKLTIQIGALDPLHVVFGPNADEDCACGKVVDDDPDEASLKPTLEITSTWVFYWGRLPRVRTRWVVLVVPGTAGVYQVLSSGEERAFLIDPVVRCTSSPAEMECAIPTTTTSTPNDCHIVTQCGSFSPIGLLCSNYFLSINPDDDVDSDPDLDSCNTTPIPLDTLSTTEEKELEEWIDIATAAGFMPVPP